MSDQDSPDVVVLCSDLFFTSQIEGTARDVGANCRVVFAVKQVQELVAAGGVRRLIVDLEFPDLDPVDLVNGLPESSRPEVIGFGPHVKVEQLKAARVAGFDQAIPRSKFSSELAEILSGSQT